MWSRDSEDATLPIKSILGGQADFDRDKVGDTDSTILYSSVSSADVPHFSIQFLHDGGYCVTINVG